MSGDVKTKEKDDSDCQTKKTPSDEQMYSALSFAVMLVVVGVPLWWKTTEVYRVALPYNEINELKSNSFEFSLTIHLATLDKERGKLIADGIENYFQPVFNVTLDVKIIPKALLGSCKNLAEIEEKITHPTIEGNLQLMEVPGLSRFSPKNVIIGQNRTIYFSMDADAAILIHTLERTLLREEHLVNTVLHVHAPPIGKLDPECSRRVSPSAEFDILFTILNPEPEKMSIDFHLSSAINGFLNPLLKEFSDLNIIHAKSQWLYLVNLKINAKKIGGDFVLAESTLPHVITPLEKKLSSHVSKRPCLNFVLWIPPCNTAPLHIYTDKGQRVRHDAFLSPRWGGLQIFNPPRNECDLDNHVTVKPNPKQIMPIFVQQFRILMGLASLDEAIADGHVTPSIFPIRQWEKDGLLRSRTIEQLTISKKTLQSLSELLGKIGNIVINDHIGAAIYGSLNAIYKCEQHLQNGQLLLAYKMSQEAFLLSEAAFTDPSLLALLYFPEDQKYAVYIPLFLPVMIPVLISFKPLREWLVKKIRGNKMKTD